jgi:hypothetical protein
VAIIVLLFPWIVYDDREGGGVFGLLDISKFVRSDSVVWDVACGSKRKTRLNNIDRVDSSVLKFHALYTTTVLFCSVGEATGVDVRPRDDRCLEGDLLDSFFFLEGEESKGSCCFHQRCMRGFCINRE